MTRNTRQLKILEIISKKDIETQDDLAAALMLEHFPVTQATISRDIKELGLVKISTPDGRQKYTKELTRRNISGKIVTLFREAVTEIDYALNIVVIKTLDGSAKTAGLMVDKLANPNVLGCVAGDDTVMVITKSETVAKEIVDTLSEFIEK